MTSSMQGKISGYLQGYSRMGYQQWENPVIPKILESKRGTCTLQDFFSVCTKSKQANDASKTVCSDGVTIVTTKPSVKNVVLNGAKTDPRLVVDNNGTMWIIWTDITRTIVNSSNICKYVIVTPSEQTVLEASLAGFIAITVTK
jgi:hypothetical protein